MPSAKACDPLLSRRPPRSGVLPSYDLAAVPDLLTQPRISATGEALPSRNIREFLGIVASCYETAM